MGIFNFLRKKAVNSPIYGFFNNIAYPDRKDDDYLSAYYTGWVYACVNAIVDDVAATKLHLKHQKGENVEIEDEHEASKLLRNVNDFMSSSDLLYATGGYLKLDGNAFWYIVRSGNRTPIEIWPLRPDRMQIVKDAKKFIGGYVFTNDKAEKVPFEANEIIHFKKFNPLNPYRGIGVIRAAAYAIDADTYASKWNRNIFLNSAIPSGILSTENTLSKDIFNRIKKQWDANYKGIENAHKVAVLDGGLKFEKVSLTPVEMDFLEQRKFSRDEILSLFRVPRSVLGITDDVNRANAEATDYIFAKRVIDPEVRFIVDKLNEFYLPMWGLDQEEYFFDYESPVPQNIDQDIKRWESGLKTGYYTINEVRDELGKQPVDWGDEPFILTPFGSTEPSKDNNSQEGKRTALKKKSASDKLVARRVKYLRKKISEYQDVFEGLLKDRKSFLIKRLDEKSNKKQNKDAAKDLVHFLFDGWNEWIGVLVGPISDALKETLAFGGKQALTHVESEISFDLENPLAKAWLEKHGLEHAESVSESIKDDMRERILNAFEEGKGAADIAETIGDFFDNESKWRALRIARSEVVAGYAEGTLEGYRQSGVVKTKRWLTAGDDRVDPECLLNEADGDIPLDKAFSTGNMVPPVHPNCRCVIIPGV